MKNVQRKWEVARGKCLRAIEEAEVVSFDVFDTLLCRLVPQPLDVAFLIGVELFPEIGFSPLKFRGRRERAEKLARRAAHAAGRGGEVTIEEIYNGLLGDVRFELCQASDGLLNWQREWEWEKRLVRANPLGMMLLDHARALGKRVVVTSDTYFSEAQVRELLAGAGVTGIDGCFISCDRGKSKHSGDLFDDLVTESGVAAARVAHIGDRICADVRSARGRGLRAARVPTLGELFKQSGLVPVERSCWWRSAGDLILLGCMARTFGEGLVEGEAGWQSDPLARAGYYSLGPVLAGFSCWLAERLRERPVGKVMFLSREGEILREGFRRLGLEETTGTVTCDLLASRLAMRKAALAAGSPATLYEHLDEIVSDFGTRAEEHVETESGAFLDQFGIGEDTVSEFSKMMKRGETGGASTSVLMPGLDQVTAEGRCYLEYVESQLPRDGQRAVALVDLGWKGTIPAGLARLLTGEVRVDTYLVASTAQARHFQAPGVSLVGYLSNGGWPRKLASQLRQNANLLETVFSSENGSLWGVRPGKSGFEPVFDPRYEGPERIRVIRGMRLGMLRLLDEVAPWIGRCPGGFEVMPEVAAAALGRFVDGPMTCEAACFEGVRMASVGVGSELEIEMAPLIRFSEVFRNPRRQMWRIRNCYWKAGSLARSGWQVHGLMAALMRIHSGTAPLRRRIRRLQRQFLSVMPLNIVCW